MEMNKQIFEELSHKEILFNIKTNKKILLKYITHNLTLTISTQSIYNKKYKIFDKRNFNKLSYLLSHYSLLEADVIETLLFNKVFYRSNMKELLKLKTLK